MQLLLTSLFLIPALLFAEWTPEEAAFLKEHPVLRYSIFPDAPPIEYLDRDGRHAGLTSDWLSRMEKQTGLQFELVPTASRTESLENLKTGRCDFLPVLSPNWDASRDFLLTEEYLRLPVVIVTRREASYVETLQDCRGKKVGVVRQLGWFESSHLKDPGPEWVEVESLKAGLEEVLRGRLFGMIGSLPLVRQIQEKPFTDLKIDGKLDATFSIAAAVHAEEPILRDILSKSFRSVSSDERQRILGRWISVCFEKQFDYRLFWKILAGMGAVFLLILYRYAVVAKYTRTLKAMTEDQAQMLRERDRIISVVSHDLRQPIQSLTVFLELLETGSVYSDSEEGLRIIRQIRSRSERVSEKMENLLVWLNTRPGAVQPRLEPLSLRELIDDSCDLLQASIQSKAVQIENGVAEGVKVRTDERMLGTVLRNLISNAVKFSPAGGVVTVRAQKREGDKIAISVTDHGAGFSEEAIRRIGSGDSTSNPGTSGEKGAGLGLKLCREFLAQLGSQMEIVSPAGQGCTVTFLLPL